MQLAQTHINMCPGSFLVVMNTSHKKQVPRINSAPFYQEVILGYCKSKLHDEISSKVTFTIRLCWEIDNQLYKENVSIVNHLQGKCFYKKIVQQKLKTHNAIRKWSKYFGAEIRLNDLVSQKLKKSAFTFFLHFSVYLVFSIIVSG